MAKKNAAARLNDVKNEIEANLEQIQGLEAASHEIEETLKEDMLVSEQKKLLEKQAATAAELAEARRELSRLNEQEKGLEEITHFEYLVEPSEFRNSIGVLEAWGDSVEIHFTEYGVSEHSLSLSRSAAKEFAQALLDQLN